MCISQQNNRCTEGHRCNNLLNEPLNKDTHNQECLLCIQMDLISFPHCTLNSLQFLKKETAVTTRERERRRGKDKPKIQMRGRGSIMRRVKTKSFLKMKGGFFVIYLSIFLSLAASSLCPTLEKAIKS